MIFPHLERQEDGSVVFDHVARPFVMMLAEVPSLLGPDAPDPVKERLFPKPGDEEGLREDWEKYVQPELYSLLASAREIVLKDLSAIAPATEHEDAGLWKIVIPKEHVNAWIGALNGARLALGAMHEIESEEDLHPELHVDPDDEDAIVDLLDERRIAIVKIHLLGELQAMLVMDQHPPPADFEGDFGEADLDPDQG